MRRRYTALILILALGIALVIGFPACPVPASPSREPARVVAVNDGDTITIRMQGKQYRTRLLGIDAPEHGQEPWGERSREHLKKLLKDLRWNVLVETDVQARDKYNRLLIYVWDDTGRSINEQMLLDGFAVLFTIQPNSRYADRFIKAQRSARERKLGIWGPDGLKERPLEYKIRHPRQ